MSQRFDWLIGTFATLFACTSSACGLVLQKLASRHEQQKAMSIRAAVERGEEADLKLAPQCCGFILSPMWIVGIVMLVIFPVPLDMVAFAFAGQSLVIPLTSATIVFTQLLAPRVLGEHLTKLDCVGTVVIVTGCVVSVAFGVHSNRTFTPDELLSLYLASPFVVAESILLLAAGLALTLISVEFTSCSVLSGGMRTSCLPVCYAVLASALGAQQTILFKSTSELLLAAIRHHGTSFTTPTPYIFVLLTVTLALGQLSWLNKGLARFEAVHFVPVYSSTLIVVNTTLGSIYFQEYTLQTPLSLTLFVVGVLLVVSGVMLFSLLPWWLARLGGAAVTDETLPLNHSASPAWPAPDSAI